MTGSELPEDEIWRGCQDPVTLLKFWLDDAVAAGESEPTALVLGTSDKQGLYQRVVLFKGFWRSQAFVFVTSGRSRKSRQLCQNPNVSWLFFWPKLQRQVTGQGTVEPLSWGLASQYFRQRPRLSQLGAWASFQSESRCPQKYDVSLRIPFYEWSWPQGVPVAPHWGAWVIWPRSWEFWVAAQGRLHQRVRFHPSGQPQWIWVDP